MSDDNKEKYSPESVPSEDTSGSGEKPAEEMTGDGWQWDAAVPETVVENLEEDVEVTISAEAVTEENKAEEEEKEEEKENDEAATDDGLCIVCGKKRGKSPSDLYCEECRSKFLRTNYGVGHIILAFVMVFIAAIGYFICVSTCEVSSRLTKAQAYISEKRYDDAVNECSSITNTVSTINSGVNAIFTGINSNFAPKDWFSEGSRATWLVLDAYTDTLTISYSERSTYLTAVDQTFTKDELNKPKNAKIKNCYDFCKEMDDFSNSISEKWQAYIEGDGSDSYVVPYDEAIAYLDSVETTNDTQKCISSYYKFMTAYYAKKDKDTMLDFFEQTYKLAGDYDYMFLQSYMGITWELEKYDKLIDLAQISIDRNVNDTTAYYYSVKVYISKEDFDTAEKLCKQLKDNNPDGLDYYSIQAEIDRRQGDFDAAIEVCKSGIKAGTDAEIYRQQAIAYMLLDDKDSALDAIKQAYDITVQNSYSNSSVSLEVMNTAALITKLCDDTATYEEIVSIFKQESIELEATVQSCIKGEITFEDIFMKGTGDV